MENHCVGGVQADVNDMNAFGMDGSQPAVSFVLGIRRPTNLGCAYKRR